MDAARCKATSKLNAKKMLFEQLSIVETSMHDRVKLLGDLLQCFHNQNELIQNNYE